MITDYTVRDLEIIMQDKSVPDKKVWEIWSRYEADIAEMLRKIDIRNPCFGALARELRHIDELALCFRPVLYRVKKAFGLSVYT